MALLEQARQVLRVKHYSYRTEQCYLAWMEQFIRFHKRGSTWRHPAEMGAAEVEQFLTHLAVGRHVSASTQNQALNALVFLYRHVLRRDLGDDLGDFAALRAIRRRRVPTVLSVAEASILLCTLRAQGHKEPYALMAGLMYGAGLRLMEQRRADDDDLHARDGESRLPRAEPIGHPLADHATKLPFQPFDLLGCSLKMGRKWCARRRLMAAGGDAQTDTRTCCASLSASPTSGSLATGLKRKGDPTVCATLRSGPPLFSPDRLSDINGGTPCVAAGCGDRTGRRSAARTARRALRGLRRASARRRLQAIARGCPVSDGLRKPACAGLRLRELRGASAFGGREFIARRRIGF